MRRAVDPARKARHDCEATACERACELARQLDRRRADIARADHRHTGPLRQRQIAALG